MNIISARHTHLEDALTMSWMRATSKQRREVSIRVVVVVVVGEACSATASRKTYGRAQNVARNETAPIQRNHPYFHVSQGPGLMVQRVPMRE